jgi:hypothetical protein
VLGASVRGTRQLSNGYMRSVSNRKVNSAAVTSSIRGSTKKSHNSTDVTGPRAARTIHIKRSAQQPQLDKTPWHSPSRTHLALRQGLELQRTALPHRLEL